MAKPRDLCSKCSKWEVCERVTQLKSGIDDCGCIVISGLLRWDNVDQWTMKAQREKFQKTTTKAAIIECDQYERESTS